MTADDADWFIQPLPGTDIALMLAMMHVLIRDGLTDQQWIAEHTLGFDELAAHVAEWTPERAAAACGVAATDIERLATLYGTIRPAVIRTLVGAEHHENGAMFFRTLACLPALVGAWRDRGGGLARSIGVWTGSVVDGNALQRPALLDGRQPRWVNMSRLAEILTETTDPPIKALVVWNCNPLVITPNVEKIRAGVLRDDLFTVVHEQFITDTARYADIVLPATTQIESHRRRAAVGAPVVELERRGDRAVRRGGQQQRTVPTARQGDGLHRARTVRRRHDRDPRFAARRSTSTNCGESGIVRVPYPDDGRPFGDGVFPTASGRVEFVSEALVAMGQPALPTFVPPDRGRPARRWPRATRCNC